MGREFKTRVVFENGLKVSAGVISVSELSHTPGHDTGEIKVYGKTDSKLYYLNENGEEYEFASSATNFLEISIFENTVATTIETADTPVAITLAAITEEESAGNWSMIPGSTGGITAYADYSGTVSGAVLITSAAHGLSSEDIISIRGTTSYNGIFEVTVVDANSFYIIETWVADDGTSDWDMGDYAIVGVGSAGKYKLGVSLTIAENGSAGSVAKIFMYVNTTRIDKTISERKFSNNDVGSMTMSGIIDLAVGDRVFLIIQSSGTNTITLKNMNLILDRQ